MPSPVSMTRNPVNPPEAAARETIDRQLVAAGWSVQSIKNLNLSESRGVAVRELPSQGGPADYVLFVKGRALGIVEAKKTRTGYETWQNVKSKEGVPFAIARATRLHDEFRRLTAEGAKPVIIDP